MQYAIVRTNGKQYKVSEGDLLTLDRIDFAGKKTMTFEDVLLVVNDSNSSIGKPNLNGARVDVSFVEDKKGDKVRVSKFKAKSRYRKTIGFRAQQTVVRIDKINFSSEKASKETVKPAKTASTVKDK